MDDILDPDAILEEQLEFLMEADALKRVERKTSILGGSRRENAAEHSWHLMLTAMTLAHHANVPVDLLKVMKMLALHDLGEVEPGDTFHYEKTISDREAEEEAAADLFAGLPDDQAAEFLALWKEFAEAHTAEAKFAHAVDRVWPIIQNYHNEGGSWIEYGITTNQVLDRNKLIDAGSKGLWRFVSRLVLDAEDKGLLIP